MNAVIRALRRQLPETAFGRNMLKVAGGAALAQAIAFAASPVLSRLYDPAAFGVFAAVAGVAATLTVIACLSYEAAIPVPRGERLARNVAWLSLAILAATVLLTALATILFAPAMARHVFDGRFAPAWLAAIPVLLAALGFNQVASIAALRARRFDTISRVRVWQAGATASIQIALYPLGGLALILGQTAGQLAGVVHLWRAAFGQGSLEGVTTRNMARTMSRYRRFPMFEGPFSLLNSAGNYLPPLLLVAFFDAAAGGLFALAQRVLSAPIGLVSAASGQVFFSAAAGANRDGTLGALVEHTQASLSRLLAPAMVLLAIAGPEGFALVFGEAWRQAGTVAALMTPWLYFQSLGSTVSTVWVVQGNLHHGTAIGAIGFALRCAALLSALWIRDWIVVTGLFSAVNALYYLAVALYALVRSGSSVAGFFALQARSLAIALLFALPSLAGLAIGGRWFVFGGLAVSGLALLPYYRNALRKL